MMNYRTAVGIYVMRHDCGESGGPAGAELGLVLMASVTGMYSSKGELMQ
jgi:6-phosphogluconate dehydrogenase (decarboxylating)